MQKFACGVLVLAYLVAAPFAQAAEEVVTIGNARAILNKPAKPRASVILVAGGDGFLNIDASGKIQRLAGNQLVRTRAQYVAHGVASLTVDIGVDLAAAVEYMRKIAQPVALVGTSKGTLRVAQAVAAGARPNSVVFTSGFMQQVQGILGSPGALPATLVVHHRLDTCRFTLPDAVEPFKQWGGGKVRVVWMTGGRTEGDPCEARAYHGFLGLDGQVVAAVAAFARSAR